MAAANPVNNGPPGPPETPIPTQGEYEITIDELIHNGWTTNWNRDYNWGNGIPHPLLRQNAGTDYESVRKPDGRWLLFSRSRRTPDPPVVNPGQGGPPPINPNPGQGGRKSHKQKKSKKTKHSRKRRRTRKHK